MGTVYEAVQDQPHRTVALKVIRPDFVSPELSRRFARESEVLGRLQHPGIAQINEAGTAEGPWIPILFAMEWCGAIPHRLRRERGLQLNQRLDLFAGSATRCTMPTNKVVVHRDLKPATSWSTPLASPRFSTSAWPA